MCVSQPVLCSMSAGGPVRCLQGLTEAGYGDIGQCTICVIGMQGVDKHAIHFAMGLGEQGDITSHATPV